MDSAFRKRDCITFPSPRGRPRSNACRVISPCRSSRLPRLSKCSRLNVGLPSEACPGNKFLRRPPESSDSGPDAAELQRRRRDGVQTTLARVRKPRGRHRSSRFRRPPAPFRAAFGRLGKTPPRESAPCRWPVIGLRRSPALPADRTGERDAVSGGPVAVQGLSPGGYLREIRWLHWLRCGWDVGETRHACACDCDLAVELDARAS